MAKRFGRKVSNTIEEKLNTAEPVLPDYLVLFFQAFKNLDRQRSSGFGVGYIPYLDIVQYARMYDMSQEVEEDLVFFEEIIKRLPTDEEHTNKFIVENAQALSQLENYQEVLDYINSLPDHVIKSYGLTTEGLEKTLDDTKELEKTITGVNSNELKVTASNDDVLQTIEDVEALIEISAKVEDGKYKIDIDANTQTAIDNINSFKNSINDLNKV